MALRTPLVAALTCGLLFVGCGRDADVFGDDDDPAGGFAPLGGNDAGAAGGVSTSASGAGGAGQGGTGLGGAGGSGAAGAGGSGAAGAGGGGTGAAGGTGGDPLSCEPMDPEPGCGPGMHCFATESGQPDCVGPVGSGQQSDACTVDAQCAADLVCLTGEAADCCVQWCLSSSDCPWSETCYTLDPPLYVGLQEYGVCYDPIWCGLF